MHNVSDVSTDLDSELEGMWLFRGLHVEIALTQMGILDDRPRPTILYQTCDDSRRPD